MPGNRKTEHKPEEVGMYRGKSRRKPSKIE